MIYVESRIISQAGKSPQYADHVIDWIRTWQCTRLKSFSDLLRRMFSDLGEIDVAVIQKDVLDQHT